MELDTIYNMDCIEGMKMLPDKSIDMILCDLPYGTTRNKWDSLIPFNDLWAAYKRIIKDNGAIILFSQMPFTAKLIQSNIQMFRYEWIWEKSKATGHLNSKKMPMKKHENICVFYKNLPFYNAQGLKRKIIPSIRKGGNGNGTNYGKSDKDAIVEFENYPTDIIQFGSESHPVHPTQKPVALCEYLIKTYTNEGDIVLDNCFGSGTTLVAAVNTNRHYIGFELEPKYFDIACNRLDDAEREREREREQ